MSFANGLGGEEGLKRGKNSQMGSPCRFYKCKVIFGILWDSVPMVLPLHSSITYIICKQFGQNIFTLILMFLEHESELAL